MTFGYFCVAIVSVVMFPYEVYFYSSGGIEEEWGPKDLLTNRITSIVGMGLVLTPRYRNPCQFRAIVRARQCSIPKFRAAPRSRPRSVRQVGLNPGASRYVLRGRRSGGRNLHGERLSIAQFFGWRWGRHKKPWEAPRFTIAWLALFVVALLIVLTGVDVMTLVELAILFSILVLPLTYLPLLLLAGDRQYMREHVNGPIAKGFGWFYFVVIMLRRLPQSRFIC